MKKNIKDLSFYQKKILVCLKNNWHKKFNEIRTKHLDLSYINFSNLTIKIDFKKFNFSYSNFSYSDFSYSDFSDSNFSDSNFSDSNFSYSSFSEQKGLSIISIDNVGSENRKTIYFYKWNKVFCGCFSGSIKEFEEKIKDSYNSSSIYYKQYFLVLDYLKKMKKLKKKLQPMQK